MSVHLASAVELWPVEKLIPYQKNSRTHSDEQIEQIAASMKEFGFTNPILVDGKQGIIAGHGRLMAAKKIGLTQVPVIVLDHLTDAQRRAYVIADNKLALNAGWDLAVLSKEIETLAEEDFNLDLLGFSDEELEDLMPEVEQAEPGDADEVPEQLAEAKVARGEVYILGKHRLMCGDSTAITDVEKLMNGEKADMVFTDPPYGMRLDADYSKMPESPSGAKPKKWESIKGDHDDFTPELIQTTLGIFSYCSEIFLCGADYFAEHIPNKNDGSWFVWDKRVTENFDRMIGSAFELIWSKKKRKREIARINNTLYSGESDAINKVHPTQKPIKLIEFFFERTEGNIVVDLFGGSGSTLIACEKTKRTCFMMEFEPHYVGVILDRWQKFTGKKAHREDGTPWDEIRGS